VTIFRAQDGYLCDYDVSKEGRFVIEMYPVDGEFAQLMSPKFQGYTFDIRSFVSITIPLESSIDNVKITLKDVKEKPKVVSIGVRLKYSKKNERLWGQDFKWGIGLMDESQLKEKKGGIWSYEKTEKSSYDELRKRHLRGNPKSSDALLEQFPTELIFLKAKIEKPPKKSYLVVRHPKNVLP